MFMYGRLNIVKMLIMPKWVYRFSVILIKNTSMPFIKWKLEMQKANDIQSILGK